MKRLVIFFICVFSFILGYAQLPDSVKHVEIVSEVRDTMLLLNKEDVDVINTAFFRCNVLDSLHVINEQIISSLNEENSKLESIISEQKIVLSNKDEQILNIKQQNKDVISDLEKQVKIANRGKTFWESISGIGVVAVILLAIF